MPSTRSKAPRREVKPFLRHRHDLGNRLRRARYEIERWFARVLGRRLTPGPSSR